MTYQSLPDLGKGRDILKDICSFDISYNLFQEAYGTSERIKDQATTRYNLFSGLPAFSALRKDVISFYRFEVLNNIILDRYRENRLIYNLYFQSMLASVLAPNLGDENKEGNPSNIHADSITFFELFIALRYFTFKELQKILSDVKKIPIDKMGISYIKEVLQCIETPDIHESVTLDRPFWKLILLLGYIDMDQEMFALTMNNVNKLVIGMHFSDIKNAIKKVVYNAESVGIIDKHNVEYVKKLLQGTMSFLAKEGRDEERAVCDLVSYLSYISHSHNKTYDNKDIIKILLDNNLQVLCLENYQFFGYACKKEIKGRYKRWIPKDNSDEYTQYCLAVGNGVICSDGDIEKRLIEYIRSEKEKNDKQKADEKRYVISIGRTEPDYIHILRLLCDLYLRDHMVNKELFIEIAKEMGDSFSEWLIDLESFDYTRFDLSWLDLCRKPLLDKIRQNDNVREKISEITTKAYNKGNLDKRMLNKYFQYFSCKMLVEQKK